MVGLCIATQLLLAPIMLTVAGAGQMHCCAMCHMQHH